MKEWVSSGFKNEIIFLEEKPGSWLKAVEHILKKYWGGRAYVKIESKTERAMLKFPANRYILQRYSSYSLHFDFPKL
jgi:hypothetical protein